MTFVRRLLVLLVLSATVSLPGCGSGGDEPALPELPPATPVPALEGTWCGPGQDRTGLLGAVCITMDAEGNVTRLSLDNQSNDAIGIVQETEETDVYTFRMTDGTFGWLALSASGEHLLYLDNYRVLAALDKTSPGLPPVYNLSDLQDDWTGRSLYLDETATLTGTAPSALSVGIGFFFTGTDGPTPFENQPGRALVVDDAQFGRYTGRFELDGGTRGDLLLMMAADKAFVVGTLCVDGGVFAQDCSIVWWERVP